MSEINVTGIDRATLLAALCNAASAQGLLNFELAYGTMTREDAQMLIDLGGPHFEYLCRQVLKIEFIGESQNSWLIVQDAGQGTAEEIVESIRQQSRAQIVNVGISRPEVNPPDTFLRVDTHGIGFGF